MEDLDTLAECFLFRPRRRRKLRVSGEEIEGSEYSEPEPNLWRLDARRPIGRI